MVFKVKNIVIYLRVDVYLLSSETFLPNVVKHLYLLIPSPLPFVNKNSLNVLIKILPEQFFFAVLASKLSINIFGADCCIGKIIL